MYIPGLLKRVNVFKTCTRPAASSISGSAGGGIATADPRVRVMALIGMINAIDRRAGRLVQSLGQPGPSGRRRTATRAAGISSRAFPNRTRAPYGRDRPAKR